jgi:hypothetical protein
MHLLPSDIIAILSVVAGLAVPFISRYLERPKEKIRTF